MKKSGYKIIGRLLLMVLAMLTIPACITWAKYSLTIRTEKIEFEIQAPDANTYTDESTEEITEDLTGAGQEIQESAVEQDGNITQEEKVENSEADIIQEESESIELPETMN